MADDPPLPSAGRSSTTARQSPSRCSSADDPSAQGSFPPPTPPQHRFSSIGAANAIRHHSSAASRGSTTGAVPTPGSLGHRRSSALQTGKLDVSIVTDDDKVNVVNSDGTLPSSPSSEAVRLNRGSVTVGHGSGLPFSRALLLDPSSGLQLLVITVNMGNAPPSASDIAAMLPQDGAEKFDLIVVGMQESMFVVNNHAGGGGAEDDDVTAKSTSSSSLASSLSRTETTTQKRPPPLQTGGETSLTRSKAEVSDDDEPTSPAPFDLRRLSSKEKKKKKQKKALKAGDGFEKLFAKIRGVTASSDTSVRSGPDSPEKSTSLKVSRRNSNVLDFTAALPEDTRLLQSLFADRLPSYQPVVRHSRGEMRLHVYVRSNLLPCIVDVTVRAENTGLAHLLANKGGIAARIAVGGTSLSFVCCHLAAHEGKQHYLRRLADIEEILGGTSVGPGNMFDVSLGSHHTFLFGDLNFRSAFEGKDKKESYKLCKSLVEAGNYRSVAASDELNRGLESGDALRGWQSCPIGGFPPTFKVLRGVDATVGHGTPFDDVYDTHRTPSYTDRVLYTSLDGLGQYLKNESSTSAVNYVASDHKPVLASFKIDVKEGVFPILPTPPKVSDGEVQLVEVTDRIDPDEICLDDLRDRSSNSHLLTPARRSCHLVFSNIKCTGLTEMDPSLLGGGSDPYIVFVPLDAELVRDESRGGVPYFEGGSNSSFFKKFPRTSVIWHNVNPKWKDVVRISLNVESEKKLADRFFALNIIDKDNFGDDDLIGTVVVNCKHLIAFRGEETPPPSPSRARDDSGSERPKIKRASKSDRFSLYSSGDLAELVSKVSIKQPILRDGKCHGHFSADAWLVWKDTTSLTENGAQSLSGAGGCGCTIS